MQSQSRPAATQQPMMLVPLPAPRLNRSQAAMQLLVLIVQEQQTQRRMQGLLRPMIRSSSLSVMPLQT